jgi:hypothetical protein
MIGRRQFTTLLGGGGVACARKQALNGQRKLGDTAETVDGGQKPRVARGRSW